VRKLLVANRGEIARRVFRTARAMGIATVAVFSDVDERAPHVAEADEAVRLPGASPADTYLDSDKVLRAAALTGADAIHPGYGFLSENADFARACGAAGITFVGPSPEVIEAMGSKIAAKELMAAAGVPVLGAEGFPLLVKAAFGGGGRGMRIVRDQAGLAEALASAEREASKAFGDGTVFLERYVENPRHIEVQIFGDHQGHVLHLFERECSIQRRYQKVIEEAPSPAVDDTLRTALCDAAVEAGRALGYVGAGTVEFVVDQDGSFFFLEVNTRLQVEHPVTEQVTGLDLVELQLRVARGEPLDIVPRLRGWAVEARLYAEDVPGGFLPVSGRVDQIAIPSGDGVRIDSGYEDGSEVSTHYDAMLAKVIATGDTREEAVARLSDALGAARIHGIPTNRDLLVRILDHPEFRSGAIDTGFIDRHPSLTEPPPPADPLHAVAAALSGQALRRAAAPVQATLPTGWRNVPSQPQRCRLAVGDEVIEVGYRFTRDGLTVEVDGEPLADVRLWHAAGDLVDLTAGGVRRRYGISRHGPVIHVDGSESSTSFTEVERLPIAEPSAAAGSMLAPLPGAVVRVLVAAGDAVVAGQTLVVLEAMKMEHTLTCTHDGTVTEVLVGAGQQVASGQVLVIVEGP
jgi:propionyl-CoA carboxylase alpha chain